jgi:hypothetical protein
MIIYAAVTVFCVAFDKIYALYGHGVYSDSMSLMFLYPLLGGVLVFLLLSLFIPRAGYPEHYRFFCNCYNSGIAALTLGSALNGVFEIAGTSSSYLIVFIVCGCVFSLAGLLGFLIELIRYGKAVL